MQHNAKSIRPFIGSKDFNISRQFYQELGFQEHSLSPTMSYFQTEGIGFYLQNAYVKDWIDNSMIFMEVDDVYRFWNELSALALPAKYEGVRLSSVQELPWGRECFLHDPAGILWHFGAFNEE